MNEEDQLKTFQAMVEVSRKWVTAPADVLRLPPTHRHQTLRDRRRIALNRSQHCDA